MSNWAVPFQRRRDHHHHRHRRTKKSPPKDSVLCNTSFGGEGQEIPKGSKLNACHTVRVHWGKFAREIGDICRTNFVLCLNISTFFLFVFLPECKTGSGAASDRSRDQTDAAARKLFIVGCFCSVSWHVLFFAAAIFHEFFTTQKTTVAFSWAGPLISSFFAKRKVCSTFDFHTVMTHENKLFRGKFEMLMLTERFPGLVGGFLPFHFPRIEWTLFEFVLKFQFKPILNSKLVKFPLDSTLQ